MHLLHNLRRPALRLAPPLDLFSIGYLLAVHAMYSYKVRLGVVCVLKRIRVHAMLIESVIVYKQTLKSELPISIHMIKNLKIALIS